MSTSIRVLHAKQPTFFEAPQREVSRDSFVEVACLVIQADPQQALEAAFARTQNLEAAWRPDAPCRSTSVGDVMVREEGSRMLAFEVAMTGFRPITLA